MNGAQQHHHQDRQKQSFFFFKDTHHAQYRSEMMLYAWMVKKITFFDKDILDMNS